MLPTSDVIQESIKSIVNDQYGNSSKYEKDNSYVYFDGKIVSNADPVSFEALTIEAGGPIYDGKDKNNRYLYGKKIIEVLNEQGKSNSWYFSDGETIYFAYGSKVNADAATFIAIGDSRVARDKNNLYFSGQIYTKSDIDRASLTHIGGMYYRDKNKIHLYSLDPAPDPLPEFDRESFTTLDDFCYAKDKYDVYWCGEVVAGADVQSFALVGGNRYAKDNRNVYYNGQLVPNAKSETFTLFPGDVFGNDGLNVFQGIKLLEGADLNSFVIEEGKTESDDWYNAKDINQKYAYGKIVSSTTITSAPIIVKDMNGKPFFSKNVSSVWIEGEMPPGLILIPKADSKTFTPLVYPYSKDADSVFWWTEPIPMADINTFKVIESVNGIDFYYALDKNSVYYRAMIVQGADSATFQTHDFNKDNYYFVYDAYDKEHKYYQGEIVE